MIPTQPGLPIPNLPDNPFQKGWQCPYCYQRIGDMQYHNCQGNTSTRPIRTLPTTDTTNEIHVGGVVSEIQMYSDFKKLLKRDTLAKFRERYLGRILRVCAESTPNDLDPKFGLDVIMEVFDEVANGFHDDATL